MNYLELLRESAERTKNCACVGLDLVVEFLPKKSGSDEAISIDEFTEKLLTAMAKQNLCPAAFKPNIAYFASLNKAFNGDFSGYASLSKILKLIRKLFPKTPIILDAKRGDISTSSFKYAVEVFNSWQADATTVSPYMGHDSVLPFREGFENKGVYILNRTSNKGASDIQSLKLKTEQPLYKEIAAQIVSYASDFPGTGAVVGATALTELKNIAEFYYSVMKNEGGVPLLIPGVGSQGGSAPEVLDCLKKLNYDLTLVRINSSSGLTFPWKKEKIAPKNWLDFCLKSIEKFLTETALI